MSNQQAANPLESLQAAYCLIKLGGDILIVDRQDVADAIAGKDVLALLPTGGGKSICFQVPGLMREGITVVVSPLIALMQDQPPTCVFISSKDIYGTHCIGIENCKL